MKFSFREVEIDDAKMLLDWRTSERITKYCVSDIEYSIENQKKWIEETYHRKDYYHWIIAYNASPIGTVNISQFKREDSQTVFGFAIGDEKHLGIGGLIPPFLYNWLFNVVNLKTIFAESFYFNVNVIKLHSLHGHSFTPSLDRVIIKGTEEMLLVTQSLLKAKWLTMKRYQDMIADFPTNKWVAAPEVLKS